MFGAVLPASVAPIAALVIVAAMFIAFLREAYPVEVVAITGAIAMLLLGILPLADAQAVFANPAPWTIAALFVIVGAMVRTGGLDWLSAQAARHVRSRPKRTLAVLTLTVLALSAFVNNTPIVVVMIPIFVRLASEMGSQPSKLLIPLSYFAIFGGMLTLIGTSTNLLVDGVVQASGLPPFGIFEITLAGSALAVVAVAYLALVGRHLLPNRESMAGMLTDRSKMRFFTEAVIPPESNLVGREVLDVQLFKRPGVRLIDVIRGEQSLRRDLTAVTLQVGDRVVLRTQMTELLSLQANKSLKRVDQISAVETTTVEVLISPDCGMVGRRLGSLALRRRYGVYPLAVHRRDRNIGRQIDDLVVRVGDTLLLEGAPADIQRLAAEQNLVNVAQPTVRAFRRSHAPIVLAVLLGIVGLSALELAPIAPLAYIGVAIVLLTGCIDADEAFGFIDGRLLALIFAMLAVGAGLDHSGAVELAVGWLTPHLGTLPPWALVLVVYLIASTLTEVVSNNAVAVILTPVALGLATALQVEYHPLVVAVMLGASASFATPIGYQTNTLVYGPGGYRFADFLRIGVPLNLLTAATAAVVIPLLFPL
ncbi:SLC13 family permease [Pseudoroseicyclus aestuarii]|uniref:Di/tricarboxylate transporter n=1 Tax=Pseudoroseicyclus aestuarii TaxID=1795041 RepID=A0A318SUQ9_9RHOB|nr:SLC13 family permease [Pseudoroseicyclus aestuarii]PYE82540.1 di/tricarboxylate transporter [Pseudoroseicyclus aestuarii]